MINKNNDSGNLPEITSTLSSLVRLMSCYMPDPSVSKAMTLVRLIDCLECHPDLPRHPAAAVAVSLARTIWIEELMKARPGSLYINENSNPDSGLQ